eukprot:TRINITY_DN70076_c0_g1_i1.p1 TRINITY_DN70076_c0_g1~~TRINITY_DN70076_c0_g1_i1.p1  ORF type:complete len:644 (-),score=79.99 TRINITY_DN70076_c0_g1_i1:361-2292(-)
MSTPVAALVRIDGTERIDGSARKSVRRTLTNATSHSDYSGSDIGKVLTPLRRDRLGHIPEGERISRVLTSEYENSMCLRVVKSPAFDLAIAVVIILNTVLVGVDQSYDLQKRFVTAMLVVESLFLFIYAVELAIRFRAFGVKPALQDGWIRLDIALLITGLTFTWLLSPAVLRALPAAFTNMGVLRTARVFRLARMVRLVVKFQSLWMLTQGLLSSAQTMVSVLVVLLVILYMFGCIGFDLIGRHDLLSSGDADELFVETAETYFSSLARSMLTLSSFIAFDSSRQVFWPLIMQDPSLLLYFGLVSLTIGVVLANLITAVMVNGAMEHASDNREAKQLIAARLREARVSQSLALFHAVDEDGSGQITRDELRDVSEEDAFLLEELTGLRDPMGLFDILDLDGSGEVDMQEFLSVFEKVTNTPSIGFEFLKLGMCMEQLATTMTAQHQKLRDDISELKSEVKHCPRVTNNPTAATAEVSCHNDICLVPTVEEVPCLRPLMTEQGDTVTTEQGDIVDLKAMLDRLPTSTPSWAFAVHASLFEKLESSSKRILAALHDGRKQAAAEEMTGEGGQYDSLADCCADISPCELQCTDGALAGKPRYIKLSATGSAAASCQAQPAEVVSVCGLSVTEAPVLCVDDSHRCV